MKNGEKNNVLRDPDEQKAHLARVAAVATTPLLAESESGDIVDGLAFLKELHRMGIIDEADNIWRVSIVAEVGEVLNLVVERRMDAKTALAITKVVS